MGLSREQVDQWPVADSGLNRRVVRALQAAGISTIGELRARSGSRIPGCGKAARRNIAWFLERAEWDAADARAWLGEWLTASEQAIVVLRYGLEDPLFRPTMKRPTLAEIGQARGQLTRERVRQVLRRALEKLRSRLAQAMAAPVLAACRRQMGGGVVTSLELRAWRGAPWLGGYEPWGVLLLLAEVSCEVTRYRDYFSALPATALQQLETRLLGVLQKANEPVRISERLAVVVLERHPDVMMTSDGHFRLATRGQDGPAA